MAIEITETTDAIRTGIREALDDPLKKACCVLRRAGSVQREYVATDNTGAGRMIALAEALETAVDGDVIELVLGFFTVTAGSPLSSFTEHSVTIEFGPETSIVYANTDDAAEDGGFYGHWVNVKNFGAKGDGVTDDTLAINCAALALPAYNVPPYGGPDLVTEVTGNPWKCGVVYIPEGIYHQMGTIYLHVGMELRGAGLWNYQGTQLRLGAGAFPSAPGWQVYFEPIAGLSLNNLFSQGVSNIALIDQGLSANSKGLFLQSAQGTFIRNLFILGHSLVGLDFVGSTIDFLWAVDIRNGPGAIIGGLMSGSAMSMEHCNASGAINAATGKKWAALECGELAGTTFNSLQFEASANNQTHCRFTNCRAVTVTASTINVQSFPIGHILYEITGDSYNVTILSFTSNSGVGGAGVMTAVVDDSPGSPTGASYTYAPGGGRGGYMQSTSIASRLTANTFTGTCNFSGVYTPSTTIEGVYAGMVSGTPRILFANGTAAQNIEIDNSGGMMRFYQSSTGTVFATWTVSGVLDLLGEYRIAGTKVLGARAAAVADATDAASVITQFNSLLAKLRTHGIIAT